MNVNVDTFLYEQISLFVKFLFDSKEPLTTIVVFGGIYFYSLKKYHFIQQQIYFGSILKFGSILNYLKDSIKL